MVDMAFLVFTAFPYLPLPLKIFLSCSLGGGGRYFSVPSTRYTLSTCVAPKGAASLCRILSLLVFQCRKGVALHFTIPPALATEGHKTLPRRLKKLGLPSLQKCVCEIFGEISCGIRFEI